MSAIVTQEKQFPEPVPPASNPMELLSRALDRGASVEQMAQLMDLHDRFEAKQARKAFDAAIASAKAQIKPIIKNREVDFTSQKGRTNYVYEDLAQIATHVDPILAAHGLSYRYRSEQDGNKISVTCVLSHRDGHSEETTLKSNNDETGNKNAIQAIASAATFLQRYTLKLALGLSAAKDDDGNGNGNGPSSDTITEKQCADLNALAEEVGADPVRFMKYMGVERSSQINAKDFEKACAALRAKGKR